MKKLLFYLLIVLGLIVSCVGCKQETIIPNEVYELPLVNRLTPTTGFDVNLSCEVYTNTNINGVTYSINLYSSNKVPIDYQVNVKWVDDKLYFDNARMPFMSTEWTTSTLIPTTIKHIGKPTIVSVNCSDKRYIFTY